jgi:hypothetical protein
MTSWRNSARAGDSIRDFIFDFGSGKDSTTVLPSHMLIEPCSFWAAAKPSNFSSPVPVNGTERLAEDVRISKASLFGKPSWVRSPLKNQGLRGPFRAGFWKGVVPKPVGPNAVR